MAFATLLLTTLPLHMAQAAMTAEEIDAYTQGQTFTFAENGEVYGLEEYLPNRRVRWAFLGGECQEGAWYQDAEQICFVYDGAPGGPQCWVFALNGDRLSAVFEGRQDGRRLYEAKRTSEPLICLGPDVGV